jgi:hypothetical protein
MDALIPGQVDPGGAQFGQHYEMFNEAVIAALPSMPARVAAAATLPLAKPLPPQAFGAIMTVQWRVFSRQTTFAERCACDKRRRRMSFGPGETEPSQNFRGDGLAAVPQSACVTFDRRELDRILGLYGRMVAAGEWRDYAIDFLRDRAVFSVFRHAAEVPIYRIEKNPKLARRQGAYSVITATGLIMRRGHELDRVLRVLDKPDKRIKLVVN